MWHDGVSGVALRKWLEELAGGGRIRRGAALDPFATSMRDFTPQGGVAAWLTLLRNGQPPPPRGNQGRQGIVDLRSAGLMDPTSTALSPLGEVVLNEWESLGVADEVVEHELARCIALVKHAIARNIETYRRMMAFWAQIRQRHELNDVLGDAEALYGLSYFNQTVGGFNPWALLRHTPQSGIPSVRSVQDLGSALPGATQLTQQAADNLAGVMRESATRGGGRKTFCAAMELVRVAEIDPGRAHELLERWESP